MAASGFTPIQIYRSSTASAVPTAGNLVAGELAINTTDEKLYFENASGVVKLLASSAGALGTVTSVGGTGTVNGITLTGTVTSSGSLTLGGTLSGVSLTTQVTGTLPVANGGTGQTTYTDGQLLIGNTTGGTLAKATLTAGTNVTITNGAGAITINAADQFVGTVTSVSGAGTVSGITLTGTVTSSGSLTLGGTLAVLASNFASQTANTILAAPNGAAGVPTFRAIVAADVPTLNQNTTGTAANVTGTVAVANGGTGQTTYTNGQLLIGNTTGGTLAKATLTAGTNVTITNGAGAITVNSTDQFVGTVTSVGGTGTVNGITLTGTVTSSGSLTLGGTLSGVSLTTQVTGTLPVANGGTGVTSSTGTTAVVLSNSPTLVTPTLGAASATSIANGLGAVGTPSYTFTGDTNTGMWSPSADAVAVSTAGSERMRIDSAGNVGIGTSAPTAKLQVSGKVVGDNFELLSGATGSIASGTLFTILTLSGVSVRTYIVSVGFSGVAPTNAEVALVLVAGNGSGVIQLRVVKLAASTGALAQVSVSGGNIQVSQGSGVSNSVDYSITRLM